MEVNTEENNRRNQKPSKKHRNAHRRKTAKNVESIKLKTEKQATAKLVGEVGKWRFYRK